MTQFSQDAMIKYNSSAMNDEFIIYEVFDPAIVEIVYIGCCPTLQFMTLPDLRQNRLFQHGKDYLIKPISTHQGKGTAIKVHAQLTGTGKMPHYNKLGYFLKRGKIICDQTGETFSTINEAAEANFCSSSNLSNHLNHKPGFNSVKGKTFRYENSR